VARPAAPGGFRPSATSNWTRARPVGTARLANPRAKRHVRGNFLSIIQTISKTFHQEVVLPGTGPQPLFSARPVHGCFDSAARPPTPDTRWFDRTVLLAPMIRAAGEWARLATDPMLGPRSCRFRFGALGALYVPGGSASTMLQRSFRRQPAHLPTPCVRPPKHSTVLRGAEPAMAIGSAGR